jgi:hypothetical protein
MRNLTLLALLLLGTPAFAQTAPAPAAPRGSPDDIRSTEIRDVFLRLDANRDGLVSETEWKTGGRTPQGFLMGDANGDRQLSPLEVEVALEKAMEDAVEKPD